MVSLGTSCLALSVVTVVALWVGTCAKRSVAAGRKKHPPRAVRRPSQVLDDAYHLRS